MFTITRRNDTLPAPLDLTELRRANTLSAARRIAHEVAYRFFESNSLLDRRIAYQTMQDILRWDGRTHIQVALTDGSRFQVAVQ